MVAGDQKYIGMYHYPQSDNFLKYSNVNANLYSLEYLMGLETGAGQKRINKCITIVLSLLMSYSIMYYIKVVKTY